MGGWGLGDWGLGIWGLAQPPIPNPQSPIPNPQSPIPKNFALKIKITKKFKILKNLIAFSLFK